MVETFVVVDTDIVFDDAYSVKLLTKPNPNMRALVVKAECKNAEVKKHITQKKTALAKLPDVFKQSDAISFLHKVNATFKL